MSEQFPERFPSSSHTMRQISQESGEVRKIQCPGLCTLSPRLYHMLLEHLLCELQRPSHLGSGNIALWETRGKSIVPSPS